MSWLVESRVPHRLRPLSNTNMRVYYFETKAEAQQQASWLRKRYGGWWRVAKSDAVSTHRKGPRDPARPK